MPIKVKLQTDHGKQIQRLRNVIDAPQTLTQVHEVLRDISDPYVPYDTGKLSQNVTVDENGVTYHQPYARRIFYGDYINFHVDKHPLATARWTDVAMANHSDEFDNRVGEIIKEAIKDANK